MGNSTNLRFDSFNRGSSPVEQVISGDTYAWRTRLTLWEVYLANIHRTEAGEVILVFLDLGHRLGGLGKLLVVDETDKGLLRRLGG
jgi:hypothetical protein